MKLERLVAVGLAALAACPNQKSMTIDDPSAFYFFSPSKGCQITPSDMVSRFSLDVQGSSEGTGNKKLYLRVNNEGMDDEEYRPTDFQAYGLPGNKYTRLVTTKRIDSYPPGNYMAEAMYDINGKAYHASTEFTINPYKEN